MVPTVVVELRQHLLADLGDGDLEDRVAPGQLGRAIFVGEAQLERALLAGARASG